MEEGWRVLNKVDTTDIRPTFSTFFKSCIRCISNINHFLSELRLHRRTIGHAPLYTGIGYTPGTDIINIDPLPPKAKEVYL